MIHITSNYFRCRAQRATFAPGSLTLLGQTPSSGGHPLPSMSPSPVKPLSPSRRTLRSLADLHKSETSHRVA